jgi:membrane-anchored mycosin MYCP
VAAPGTDVRSLTADGGTGPPLDGTSFAAPLVAGLAALIRERHPGLSAREVMDRITATARRPPAGRDDAVGSGVVDLVAALTAEPAALGSPAPGVTSELTRSAPAAPRAGWPLAALVTLLTIATATTGVLRRRPGTPPP